MFVGDPECGVDGCRRRAPVLVELEADCPRDDLLHERLNARRVAFAQKSKVERQPLGGLEHPMNVPCARCAGRGTGSVRRAGSPADHGRDAAIERLPRLLRADEMDMRIDSAGGENPMLTGDDFGRGSDLEARGHAILDIRVAGFADRRDPAVAYADVGFDHPPVIEDDRVRDHQVRCS